MTIERRALGLQIRAEREARLDLRCEEASDVAFAAFYADWRGSEEAAFGLQMPRGNRRPEMAGFRFGGGAVRRRPTSPDQAGRG